MRNGTYNCEPRRRIRRSSSAKSAVSIFSGLGELSLYAVVSDGAGTRNDDRLEGLPPIVGFADAAAEAAADANIDGAKTSYAEALQKTNQMEYRSIFQCVPMATQFSQSES